MPTTRCPSSYRTVPPVPCAVRQRGSERASKVYSGPAPDFPIARARSLLRPAKTPTAQQTTPTPESHTRRSIRCAGTLIDGDGRYTNPHPSGVPPSARPFCNCACMPSGPRPLKACEDISSSIAPTKAVYPIRLYFPWTSKGLPTTSRRRREETLRGLWYSVPVPAGETTGSLCARMCAIPYRLQSRHGPGATPLQRQALNASHAQVGDSQVTMLS